MNLRRRALILCRSRSVRLNWMTPSSSSGGSICRPQRPPIISISICPGWRARSRWSRAPRPADEYSNSVVTCKSRHSCNSGVDIGNVRGAYYGPLGRTERRFASVGGQPFEAPVDLFDAERDRFPYDDGSFETVLACELIEHLLRDPMHLLLECRRILEEGGRLIVTTPNVASLTSVARVLHGYDNPQISSAYQQPRAGAPDEIQHVREYTAFELRTALESAGFQIEALFTEPIAELAMNRPMWNFLEDHGYNTSLRGEQTYCVAVKRSGLPLTRYPRFLYSE